MGCMLERELKDEVKILWKLNSKKENILINLDKKLHISTEINLGCLFFSNHPYENIFHLGVN